MTADRSRKRELLVMCSMTKKAALMSQKQQRQKVGYQIS